MSWIQRLLKRERLEVELDKELQFHIERMTQDLVAEGMDPVEARRQARLTFGGVDQTKEACRDERGVRWVEDFFADCRYGIRLLRRSPMFAAAAVLTLGLGIGATTAIFSLMDLVMLRMMPVRQPERLVQFQKFHSTYGRGSISYPLFEQFQRGLSSFEGVFAHSWMGRRDVRIDGPEEQANLELVSGAYYSVLGINAAVGRTFDADADRTVGASPVAVISHEYWSRRFAGDPAVIGRTIQIKQTAFTIIGVMPAEFHGVSPGRTADVTVPLAMDGQIRGSKTWLTPQTAQRHWLQVMGRLKDGLPVSQAQAEVATLFAADNARYAIGIPKEIEKQAVLGQRIELEAAGNGFDEMRERFSQPLTILMVTVGLVLLIACANIANLLLSKAAARQREIAVRLSIGAGRGRIIRQLLTEGLLLSTLGGALGVLLAFWLGNGVITMMSNGGPRIGMSVNPDARMLAFAFGTSVFAAFLFSLAPAIQATRPSLQPTLNEARAGRWRLGKGLIVCQVAISLLLLVGAGLFGRTLINMYTLDAGFDRHGVLMFAVNSAKAGYKDQRLTDLEKKIRVELSTLPGVVSASTALMPPISGGGWDGSLLVEGYTHSPQESDTSHLNGVGPGFFKTLGTPVLLGREFDERDTPKSPKVAVVNETFARHYFKDRPPIGKWISMAGPAEKDHIQIIGVVKNMKYRSLRQEFPKTVFFTAMQPFGGGDLNFYVRTAGPPTAMTPSIDAALQRVDPALKSTNVRSLEDHIAQSILTERMLATLAGFFGFLALLLASIGIYGVMAFQMARRKRELGIRLALGARPGALVAMVMGETARLLLAGCAIGIGAALLLTRFAQKLLFGIKSDDPLTFGLAMAGLCAVAMLASYLPGRGVSRLNPADTLRSD